MGVRLPQLAVALSALSLSSLSIAACGFFMEPTPDVENAKQTSAPGFTLSYPGNWTPSTEVEVVEDTTITTLTVESSGNAVAMLQVYEPALPMSAEQVFGLFMEGVAEAGTEELGGLASVKTGTSAPMERTVMGETWEGRKGTFSVTVLGEQVPATVETVVHVFDERSVVLVTQAPTEDWSKAKPGFTLIEETLAAAE